MNFLNLDFILYVAFILSGVVAFFSGIYLVLRSFFSFRAHINRSLNMEVELIRVTKIFSNQDKEGRKSNESWKEEIGAMEQLLSSLTMVRRSNGILSGFLYGDPVISFEIANSSRDEEIVFFVGIPKKFRETVEKQINSFFPNAVLEKSGDYNIFYPGSFTRAANLKLKKKYFLPIRTYEDLEVDPLNALANALSKFEKVSEGGAIQLVMRPAKANWRMEGRKIAQDMQQGKRLKDVYSSSFLSSLLKGTGKFFLDTLFASKNKDSLGNDKEVVQLTPEDQETIKNIEKKINKAAFEVNIRLVASAGSDERAEQILAQLENSFSQYENSDINCFQVSGRAKKKDIAYNFIFRNFIPEQAMILGVEEIASIFHLPISATEAPKIKWLKSGKSQPPVNIPEGGIKLGFNEYRGQKTTIRITDSDRRRHIYTIGQTGTGKSSFLQEMAKQDAKDGKGFCFIDPHGDAIEDILTCIPKERAEEVIVFDPADIERPFGLNMLEYDANRPEQKTFVINEMIGIFDQLYDLKSTGGPMFEQYMRNAMLLVMDDPDSGSTLMEIPKVLSDPDFRKMKISKSTNPVVIDFWTKEAEKAGGEAALANMVPYITSKLTTFISNDMMRPIIAQQNSTINFRKIMDEGKILLINLSKGKIGEINARLLGMVVVGKILMAGLSRADIAENDRKDFYLYLDEFQNVTTNSISQILSEARKYHLCLILAHQFIGQLKEEISKAVFGNVGSLFSFRVGAEDADFLQKQFEPIFTANDLVNVDNYNCFSRILINNELSKPFNMSTFPPTGGDQEVANAIKELSRLKFGRDKNVVNREIMARAKFSQSSI